MAEDGVDPGCGCLSCARAELLRVAPSRRFDHYPGPDAEEDRAPRRSELLRRVARQSHDEGRLHGQFHEVRHGQGPERESGVRFQRRPELAVPVPCRHRLRKSSARLRQQPVRALRTGRLETRQQHHDQRGRSLGLRDQHAEQQLGHARQRGFGPRVLLPHVRTADRRPDHVVHPADLQPLRLHLDRQQPEVLQRHDPTPPGLQLGSQRQREDGRYRRLGPLLRPHPAQRHHGRRVPTHLADLRLLLHERPDQGRNLHPKLQRPGGPLEPLVSVRRGAQGLDCERRCAGPAGLPPRQQHAPATLHPVESRRAAATGQLARRAHLCELARLQRDGVELRHPAARDTVQRPLGRLDFDPGVRLRHAQLRHTQELVRRVHPHPRQALHQRLELGFQPGLHLLGCQTAGFDRRWRRFRVRLPAAQLRDVPIHLHREAEARHERHSRPAGGVQALQHHHPHLGPALLLQRLQGRL